jgi:hypothetical protein
MLKRDNDENKSLRGKELARSDIIEISSDEEDREVYVKITIQK